MESFTSLCSLLSLFLHLVAASPISSARAILQFEVDFDTYTSDTSITIPGTLTLGKSLVGATIAEIVDVENEDAISCQAFAGDVKLAEPFNLDRFTTFDAGNKVNVTSITCGEELATTT